MGCFLFFSFVTISITKCIIVAEFLVFNYQRSCKMAWKKHISVQSCGLELEVSWITVAEKDQSERELPAVSWINTCLHFLMLEVIYQPTAPVFVWEYRPVLDLEFGKRRFNCSSKFEKSN